MTIEDFLQSAPLYKTCELDEPPLVNRFAQARPQLPCSRCGGNERTFRCISPTPREVTTLSQKIGTLEVVEADKTYKFEYQCVACDSFRVTFLVTGATNKRVLKSGRSPPPEIQIPKELKTALGSEAPYFTKGRISEEHGFGIGAYAYYRRIVENNIGSLLEEIAKVLPLEEKAYRVALEKVRKSRIADEKIKIVKDLLPATLRPAGQNPLALIHDVLSEGIHSKSDDECLELAEDLRIALTTLVQEVARHSQAQRDFTRAINRLQKRKKTSNEQQ